MIAIITADIVNSAAHETSFWMRALKENLSRWGSSPVDWEIYRGDEFQLRTDAEMALQAAIELKSGMKASTGLDMRIAIGLGDEEFKGSGISESNGSAYRRSGRMLEGLKLGKKNIGIDTGDAQSNRIMNLMIDLASDFMDSWSPVSAELVAISLAHPNLNQLTIAERLNINQSAVSQRRKRARLSLLNDLLDFYHELLKELNA